MEDTAHSMRPFATERQLTGAIAIERGTPLDQLVDIDHTVVHEHPNGVLLAQAVAGRHRVGEVFLG